MRILYYTVYLSKTDEIVASGTSKECAKLMGKSINGFHSMISKNMAGIHKKYMIVKENVNVEEDETFL